MESSASLRSLEAFGRPFGTERSSNIHSRPEEPQRTAFPEVTSRPEEEPREDLEPEASPAPRDPERSEDRVPGHGPGTEQGEDAPGSEAPRETPAASGRSRSGPDQGSPPTQTQAVPAVAAPGLPAELASQPLGTGRLAAPAPGLAATAASNPTATTTPLAVPVVGDAGALPSLQSEGLGLADPLLGDVAAPAGPVDLGPAPQASAPIASTGGEAQAVLSAPSVSASAQAPEASFAATPEAPLTQQDIDRAGAILNQVKVALSPNQREALIHLNPPELGRISIRFTLEEGRASAVVRAESVEALDVLSRHLPELRASLEQQGLKAEEFDLGLGFQDDDQSRRFAAGEGKQGQTKGRQGEPSSDESNTPSLDRTRLAHALRDASGVDLLA